MAGDDRNIHCQDPRRVETEKAAFPVQGLRAPILLFVPPYRAPGRDRISNYGPSPSLSESGKSLVDGSLPIYAFLAISFHNLPQIFADPGPILAKVLDVLALRSHTGAIFVKGAHKVYRTRYAGQERWLGEAP